jgi:REP element-mobilizing transposase RayT
MPWLHKSWRPQLFALIGSIIRNNRGQSIAINGIDDHVHILCFLPRDMTIADFIRTIKSISSYWCKTNHCEEFAWQQGYSIFAVSQSQLDKAEKYILGQETHHKEQTFDYELNRLLFVHGISPQI